MFIPLEHNCIYEATGDHNHSICQRLFQDLPYHPIFSSIHSTVAKHANEHKTGFIFRSQDEIRFEVKEE